MGCRAGNMEMTYNYTVANKGIDTAASYPYTGKAGGSCAFKPSSVGATISSWQQVSGEPVSQYPPCKIYTIFV